MNLTIEFRANNAGKLPLLHNGTYQKLIDTVQKQMGATIEFLPPVNTCRKNESSNTNYVEVHVSGLDPASSKDRYRWDEILKPALEKAVKNGFLNKPLEGARIWCQMTRPEKEAQAPELALAA